LSVPTDAPEPRVTAALYNWNQHPIRIRLARDLVRVEESDRALLDHVLGDTVVVDTLDQAFELDLAVPYGFRYVTHAGEVLEADGTLRAGPLTAAMGLLSRRSELEAIGAQIVEVDMRIASLTEELNSGNATVKALAEEENGLRNAIYQSNTQKVELTSAIAQTSDKRNALGREEPLLDRELQGLLDQVGRLKDEEAKLLDQRQALEIDQVNREQQVEQLSAEQQQLADDLKTWGEELTAARVSLGQVQEKQLASQQAVARQTAAKAELAQQIERLTKSADAVASRRENVEAELQEAKLAEANLANRQEALKGDVETVAADLSVAQKEVQQLTGEVESFRGEHGEIEHELSAVDIKLSELRVRIETLVTRTNEELQLDLPAKYAALAEPLEDGTPGPGYQPGDMDWDAVAAEIKELKEKIQRLGNVNLDSIPEMDELEQRQQFLSKQYTDLVDSKKQLEELIDTINRESGVRFEQTFNAVREHFQGMFRKLFGGGRADIYLETELEEKVKVTGEDGKAAFEMRKRTLDPLEAGIEVIARPPGKQPVSISQLSGGEKAMTCIALLMSIFKSKPSPFCILDEVDAPLDEANNQRFGLIIQEFLAMSQFIVITHHKRTMQIADVLYGVTMQEQGVSKRVAVKFDQVDNQGRISESAAA
jgi:chromosome segregation protein